MATLRSPRGLIPVGLAWLNLIERWWRIFRHKAFVGASLVQAEEIAYATCIATAQRNRHANPSIWGRPPHRQLRRCFVYRLLYRL